MKSSKGDKNVCTQCSVLLIVLIVTGVASAQQQKKNAPAPAPHAAAPGASHAAPAQHPAGATANRGPSGGANANRGPGGMNSNNRAPGGANMNNRGPGGGSANANRGPGGMNSNNRGPGGANTMNRSQAGANNRGPGGANTMNRGQGGANNRPGGANTMNRGQAGPNNRPGERNANNRGPGGNRPGEANHHQPTGSRQVAMRNGGHATFRQDGKVREIRTAHGMRVERGIHGGRRVEGMHNGRRVVSYGARGGYSQRAYYNHGGRVYVQRTYYVGGVRYAYAYHSYYYGGYAYYGYAPAYYYGPAYYGWAYNPWPAPVYYNWGWAAQPWYGYYGPYWAPYPVYPTAAFWLTDYFIAASLRAAYEAGQANAGVVPPAIEHASAGEVAALWSTDPLIAAQLQATYGPYMMAAAAGKNATQLTPEVKQAIADEMKQEIAAEQAAAKGDKKDSGGEEVPAALDPKIRIFVVASNLDATTSEGEECSLTAGDVIERTSDEADEDHMVDVTVKSSKKDDCAVGASVGVETGELQEMHNHLRENMDAGLKELAAKQGKDGIPSAPDTKTQTGEVPAPTPDAGVDNDLQQTNKEADQAEADAQQAN